MNLNNFNGLLVVVSSLCSAAIYRLKNTWARIPKTRVKAYSKVCDLVSTDSSSKAYRTKLHQCNGAVVPHLGKF
jgi:hypothetical protein